MQSSTPNLVIFYFGAAIILGLFLYVIVLRFKNEDKIDLNEHKTFLIVYTILLVGAIYTWGVVYKIIWFNYKKILIYNQEMESNGKEKNSF